MRWRGIFKGISQYGGRADFSKNLRASLFNKYLLNEPKTDPSRCIVLVLLINSVNRFHDTQYANTYK
jgi:hypothetical protein